MKMVTTASLAYIATLVIRDYNPHHFFSSDSSLRFDFAFLLPPCSLDPTLQRTRNISTTLLWSCWRIRRRGTNRIPYSHGGTGALPDPSCSFPITYSDAHVRQIFPREVAEFNRNPVHKESVLSKIKERRRRILAEVNPNGQGDESLSRPELQEEMN